MQRERERKRYSEKQKEKQIDWVWWFVFSTTIDHENALPLPTSNTWDDVRICG